MIRRVVPVLVVAAALALPFASTEVVAASAAVRTCSDVLFVGARGSGQTATDARGFGPEVDQVRSVLASQLPGLRIHPQAVQYASASVNELKPTAREYLLMTGLAGAPLAVLDYKKTHLNPYMASVQDGTDEVIKILRSRMKCSSERIVLAGYSQGAIAVHRALQKLAHSGESSILERIDGVELIADGDRVPGSASTVVGTPPADRAGSGIAVWAGQQKKDVPQRLVPLTIHVCDDADIVCDFSLTNIKSGRKIHTTYADRSQISVAAQQLALQVKRPTADATGRRLSGWLWQFAKRATGDGASGVQREAKITGIPYANSTSQWVGCNGTPASAEYSFTGAPGLLTGVLGLDSESTPPALVVAFTIVGDGRTIASYVLNKQQKIDLAIDISGIRTMTISAITTAGTCSTSHYGYGVLGRARLD